ncbi:phosphoribosylglycinamide formyltransferase [Brevundimonas albigilva]|uniref:Phosphoribosylglycinamide formyltransferase n=2 Tax=Caulobacteraceae TaxID=76892 RepID=A0ABY4SS21_9CAUL|nr:phosphoribosylglycinamide formyltransferase [Brevundimonas albigilva]UQV19751.1 phosphoribosylglycinamide formyltransferase [Brevundimonas albigilva]URI16995.1 phosphoribosylglycinamide formyltransferase [Brevundimonas albigilva]
MAALIDAGQAPDSAYEVALVLSNVEDAGGLAVAGAKGVATTVIPHRPYGQDRAAHERAVDTALRTAHAQVVALAGYMRVLTPWLVGAWRGRMLNIHPSLLPLYPGLDTHARAIAAGDAEAGCTVHLVTEGVDEGPILDQARVPILAGDTTETLAQRVLTAEHQLYPRALDAFCRALPRT